MSTADVMLTLWMTSPKPQNPHTIMCCLIVFTHPTEEKRQQSLRIAKGIKQGPSSFLETKEFDLQGVKGLGYV